MQANALKSVQVTFTTRRRMCPPVHMEQHATSLRGSCQIPRTLPGQKTHLAPPYLH
jgi:hypothetical protein